MGSIEGGSEIGSSLRSDTDFQRIWEEAKSRWLRPKEIYDILHSYGKFSICAEPPNLPPSGTLILFDRKILRNFRRDGHPWRKKKDNKTVKEAHEHLKVGSEEKIHVYYAHGEGDSNLQRRVYWLLDKKLEHIVLVHYLQVKEGNRINAQQPWQQNSSGGMPGSMDPAFEPPQSSSLLTNAAPVLSPGSSEGFIPAQQKDFTEFDSNDDFDTFSLEELRSSGHISIGLENLAVDATGNQIQWLPHSMHLTGQSDVQTLEGSFREELVPSLGQMPSKATSNQDSGMYPQCAGVADIHSNMGHIKISQNSDGEESNIHAINTLAWEDLVLSNSTVTGQVFKHDARLPKNIQMPTRTTSTGEGVLGGLSNEPQVTPANMICMPCSITNHSQCDGTSYEKTDQYKYRHDQQWPWREDLSPQMTSSESDQSAQFPLLQSQTDDEEEVFKKLDSLDRWMNRELPVESQSSPVAVSVDSCCYLDTPMHDQSQSRTGEISNLAQPPYSSEELTPSFPQRFFFDITDFSPTWGFSSEKVKVIVTGQFIGDPHDFDKVHWCCMFGDVEVAAEIVQTGVLRCKAPQSTAGQVPFCVTDGNKQVCSNLKEFEFRTVLDSQQGSLPSLHNSRTDQVFDDEMLQIRFARLLLSNFEDASLSHQKILRVAPSLHANLAFLTATHDKEWAAIEKLVTEHGSDSAEVTEQLLQMFFKQRLKDWILSKAQQEGKGPRVLDSQGQGILHLASALGYEWVVDAVLAANISIDFRDRKGWTALHWAAFYGREKMVVALLAAGAKPGLISDPTPEHPAGWSPADVAALAGYDGIAGFLSECDLTSHLEVLTLSENEHDKQSAVEQGHRVVEYLKRSASLRQGLKTVEDELSLEDSLSAVGKATAAAARIHAAFREYSLKERLRVIAEVDEYGLLPEESRALFAAQKIQKAYRKHRERKLQESAALRIQNKFRGWKGRKDFLIFRQKVIKIQAYFRMHQARKQYHKIIWSVGVLEKALLRWRQKRKGLRGFHVEISVSLEGCDDDFLKIGRKQAEDALERSVVRVQAMVRSRLARQQYRRMLESLKQAKEIELNSDAMEGF